MSVGTKTCAWVVVANGALAKVFQSVDGSPLELVEEHEHPQSRMCQRDLHIPPGGYTEAEPIHPTGTHEEEEILFAKQLVKHLDACHVKKKFNKLYLIAGPKLLGYLRQEMRHHTMLQKTISGEVHRDLTHQLLKEIREHLPPTL
ncbi:MAG: host attachment protein [Verrucomicrobia bacterium]|nr:host attachment protein [Verrucomicrobiota bacterium]